MFNTWFNHHHLQWEREKKTKTNSHDKWVIYTRVNCLNGCFGAGLLNNSMKFSYLFWRKKNPFISSDCQKVVVFFSFLCSVRFYSNEMVFCITILLYHKVVYVRFKKKKKKKNRNRCDNHKRILKTVSIKLWHQEIVKMSQTPSTHMFPNKNEKKHKPSFMYFATFYFGAVSIANVVLQIENEKKNQFRNEVFTIRCGSSIIFFRNVGIVRMFISAKYKMISADVRSFFFSSLLTKNQKKNHFHVQKFNFGFLACVCVVVFFYIAVYASKNCIFILCSEMAILYDSP